MCKKCEMVINPSPLWFRNSFSCLRRVGPLKHNYVQKKAPTKTVEEILSHLCSPLEAIIYSNDLNNFLYQISVTVFENFLKLPNGADKDFILEYEEKDCN